VGVAAEIIFLTPLGGLLALGAVIPLAALVAVRRRAGSIRRTVGLSRLGTRRLVAPLVALFATAGLVGLAATQPVVERTSERGVRTDAEAFVVLDVSRSMLAQRSVGSPMRIDRAKVAASTLRASLPDIPVGIATLTDRVLPHLFPSADEDVFRATLDRSIGIERPPPRGSFLTSATKLDSLAAIRGQRFFSPSAKRRLVVVLTDGESQPVAGARLGALFRREPAIESVFVQFWREDERVFSGGQPEPQYLPDPSARLLLDSLVESTGGSVYSEDGLDAAARKARALLGDGPTVTEGLHQGRTGLAPYLAAAAFLPLGLLLWRRDR